METNRIGSAIFFGVTAIFMIGFIVSLIFSLILKFSSLEEQSVQLFIIILSFISVFIGGFMSGGKSGSKGWLIGGATGLVYSLLMLMLQFLGYNQLFSMNQLLFHAGFLTTAILGGVMGVNLSGYRQT
ncbi:TIGR04086 family membrane protein [Priestia megaterium]|nr:TIGR04086 family membrane protein [Priestia megaterium]